LKATLNLLLLFLAINVQMSFSQIDTINSALISASGNFISSTDFSVSYSVGELIVATIQNTNLYLTQGFQQANFNDTCSSPLPLPVIQIFPNPFTTDIYIDFLESGIYNFHIEVFNLKGSKVYLYDLHDIFYGERKTIGLSELAKGIYFLNVKSFDGKVFKKFKIVKI
jgi:hypothetical protein